MKIYDAAGFPSPARIRQYPQDEPTYQPYSHAIRVPLRRCLSYFNSSLSNQAFVINEQFPMVDISLFVGLSLADFAKVEIPAHLRDSTYEHQCQL